tara:strand:+ start:2733 stop:3572 length:840 start_codon:yes stop_codon:yes gene_type:complete
MDIFQKYSLENDFIKIDYIPEYGGIITSFIDKSKNQEWVWYKEKKEKLIDDYYDGSWTGGWEELFPCDFQESFSWGLSRDHGELWGRQWEIIDKSSNSIELKIISKESNTEFKKKFILNNDKFYCEYNAKIKFDDHFLFKLHLAIPNDNNYIKLENTDFTKVDDNFGNIYAEKNYKELVTNPSSKTKYYDFFYIENHNNQIEVINKKTESKILLSFEEKTFPYFWLFQTQGGWMDKNVSVLEPSTNSLKLIKDAVLENGAIKGPIENFTTWYRIELSNV